MKRKIVTINEEKCNGCGLCVNACQEGALQIVNGKAKLISESYCDGLGNCLPECPTGAIIIEEKEAAAFDEEAVRKHMEKSSTHHSASRDTAQQHCGCPGSRARTIIKDSNISEIAGKSHSEPTCMAGSTEKPGSQLRQWPCQIKLVPVNAPYLDNAHLLIAADCTAYAYAGIHADFMRDKITLIGCPKLDEVDYSEKLAQILANHNIKSITVLRMEVPCCGGIVNAVKNAMISSGNMVPWSVVTISTDGGIIDE